MKALWYARIQHVRIVDHEYDHDYNESLSSPQAN